MTHGTHNSTHSSPKSPMQSWSPKASALGGLCDSKERRHFDSARGSQANAVYVIENFAGRNLSNQNIRILEL